RVVGMNERLAAGGAVDLDLRKGVALEALDQYEIDRRHLADQRRQVPFRLVAQFMQHREATRRRNDHLGRAGRPVHERVLARLVEVEAVMRVLERRDAQAPRRQTRNELRDQGGFAGTAPAGQADDAHAAYIGRFTTSPQTAAIPKTTPGRWGRASSIRSGGLPIRPASG